MELYNFKVVDHYISNQTYVFKMSYEGVDGVDEYQFVYIPVNQFPAMLMMRHLIAQGDVGYSSEMMEYLTKESMEINKDVNEVLIVKDSLSSRDAFSNTVGVYSQDIVEGVNSREYIGIQWDRGVSRIESKVTTSVPHRIGESIEVIDLDKNPKEMERMGKGIKEFVRSNEIKATSLDDLQGINYRNNEGYEVSLLKSMSFETHRYGINDVNWGYSRTDPKGEVMQSYNPLRKNELDTEFSGIVSMESSNKESSKLEATQLELDNEYSSEHSELNNFLHDTDRGVRELKITNFQLKDIRESVVVDIKNLNPGRGRDVTEITVNGYARSDELNAGKIRMRDAVAGSTLRASNKLKGLMANYYRSMGYTIQAMGADKYLDAGILKSSFEMEMVDDRESHISVGVVMENGSVDRLGSAILQQIGAKLYNDRESHNLEDFKAVIGRDIKVLEVMDGDLNPEQSGVVLDSYMGDSSTNRRIESVDIIHGDSELNRVGEVKKLIDIELEHRSSQVIDLRGFTGSNRMGEEMVAHSEGITLERWGVKGSAVVGDTSLNRIGDYSEIGTASNELSKVGSIEALDIALDEYYKAKLESIQEYQSTEYIVGLNSVNEANTPLKQAHQSQPMQSYTKEYAADSFGGMEVDIPERNATLSGIVKDYLKEISETVNYIESVEGLGVAGEGVKVNQINQYTIEDKRIVGLEYVQEYIDSGKAGESIENTIKASKDGQGDIEMLWGLGGISDNQRYGNENHIKIMIKGDERVGSEVSGVESDGYVDREGTKNYGVEVSREELKYVEMHRNVQTQQLSEATHILSGFSGGVHSPRQSEQIVNYLQALDINIRDIEMQYNGIGSRYTGEGFQLEIIVEGDVGKDVEKGNIIDSSRDRTSPVELDGIDTAFIEGKGADLTEKVEDYGRESINAIEMQEIQELWKENIAEVDLRLQESDGGTWRNVEIIESQILMPDANNRYIEMTAMNIVGNQLMSGKGVIFDLPLIGDSSENRYVDVSRLESMVRPRKDLTKSFLDEAHRDDQFKLIIDSLSGFKRVGDEDELELIYETQSYREATEESSTMEKEFLRNTTDDLRVNVRDLDKGADIETSFRYIGMKLDNKSDIESSIRDIYSDLEKEFEWDPDKWHDFELEETWNPDKEDDFNLEETWNPDKIKDTSLEKVMDFNKENRFEMLEDYLTKGLLYDYSNIIENPREVEDWGEGYFVPNDYDPSDPFNTYYPWIEEITGHELVQASEWDKDKGWWKYDHEKVRIRTEGEGMILSEHGGEDFKFNFTITAPNLPDCRSGFVFNYVDSNNYYKFTISSGSTPFLLEHVKGGEARRIATPIEQYFIDAGTKHTVNVEFIDNKLKVYTDGRIQYDLLLEGI